MFGEARVPEKVESPYRDLHKIDVRFHCCLHFVLDQIRITCDIAPMAHLKRPRDPNQRAKEIVGIATGLIAERADESKNPHAVALGRLGGLKGGKARALALSKKDRSRIAKKAANARWNRK